MHKIIMKSMYDFLEIIIHLTLIFGLSAYDYSDAKYEMDSLHWRKSVTPWQNFYKFYEIIFRKKAPVFNGIQYKSCMHSRMLVH